MLGYGALGQLALGQTRSVSPTAIAIGWFGPLSEPVRKKRGEPASAQQFFTFNPRPVVSFSWFGSLSEPVRPKRCSPAALSPYFFMHPAPSPFVASGWFAPLSDPVRAKRRSPAALSPFLSWQPAPSPFVPTGWYANLSDPVRQKIGLKAALQLAYAGPARLMPNPQTTGVMSAIETKDVFLAGAMAWNRATDAEIGVINTTPQPAEIGLYQTGPAAGTITVRISIIIG